ncbi:gp019 [Erwinia phage vB_EamP-S6]|uniref:Gp019 n=1 Tax=Erwinia phage vB_EamP-S6 TaxID=1051675 RepID=G0YQB1_9CAUD|nr:gp019 [Erwinia phage vB_EamP-S6]AEJ81538.1 gp019 [Erwinia phage vB_EamP-S6]
MQITEIIYIMYATNHNGWALNKEFALRSPLTISRGWWILQANHYELLERVVGNKVVPD